jgi:hypothetical protein
VRLAVGVPGGGLMVAVVVVICWSVGKANEKEKNFNDEKGRDQTFFWD